MADRIDLGIHPRTPYRVSAVLAAAAVIASSASFYFWGVFRRDAPFIIGNMRGTALSMLVLAGPVLIVSMILTARGSLRARFVWLGSLAYIAYNALLFCFMVHFNSFFLLFAALLGLSFWALLTLLASFDLAAVQAAGSGVPGRTIAVYMMICLIVFGFVWLQDIVPAMIQNTMPASFEGAGLAQNAIYVLDFAFTFPMLAVGAAWLWRRRAWGYPISGMMVIMLTIETAGIAVDQAFGRLHDPSASAGAVPIMLALSGVGLIFSVLFLRGINDRGSPTSRPAR